MANERVLIGTKATSIDPGDILKEDLASTELTIATKAFKKRLFLFSHVPVEIEILEG